MDWLPCSISVANNLRLVFTILLTARGYVLILCVGLDKIYEFGEILSSVLLVSAMSESLCPNHQCACNVWNWISVNEVRDAWGVDCLTNVLFYICWLLLSWPLFAESIACNELHKWGTWWQTFWGTQVSIESFFLFMFKFVLFMYLF